MWLVIQKLILQSNNEISYSGPLRLWAGLFNKINSIAVSQFKYFPTITTFNAQELIALNIKRG